MKNDFLLVAICLLSLILARASAQDNNTYLRVKNDSVFPFKDIVVNSRLFGNLKAGEFSTYQMSNRAYAHGSVSLIAGTNSLDIRPIDIELDQSPLGPGRFTYSISVWTNYELTVVTNENLEPPLGTVAKTTFGKPNEKQPRVRVTNGSNVEFWDVQLAQSVGKLKPGETSAYYYQGGSYLPGQIEVFLGELPGRGRLGNWERNHLRWNSYEAAKETYGGWFTLTVNIRSNLRLDLLFIQDKP